MNWKYLFLILLVAGVASASTYMIDKPKPESEFPISVIGPHDELGRIGNRNVMDGKVKFKHYREFFNDGKIKINFYDIEFNAAVANEISGFLNR